MDIIKKHRKYNTEIRKKINSDLHKIKDEHFMQQIYNLIIEDIGHNYSKNINGIFINLNILSDFCIDKLINTLEEYSKYSKHDKNKNTTIPIFCDEDILKNFIINIKYNVDIYDKTNILEFGGKIYDFELMKKTILVLLNYYKKLEIKNNFNLFIIKILYKYWKDNNIPIEIINDILLLDKTNKSFFETNILLKYEDSIEKCVYYINTILTIRNKLKESINNKDLMRLENINLLSYIIYNMRCLSIISYVKNSFININLKNKILEQLLNKKEKYETLLST